MTIAERGAAKLRARSLSAAAGVGARCVLLLVLISLSSRDGATTEMVSSTVEFQIHRDFSRIILTDSQAKELSFFFDVKGLTERTTLPKNEAQEVGKAATELVSSKFHLVSSKSEANFIVQIRVDNLVNYAIRNPRREPSRGLVMISVCRLPIVDVVDDCGNLTFFYFGTFQGVDVLKKVFPVWAAMTLRSSP
jgi:hypothetical protein